MPRLPEVDYSVVTQGPPNVAQAFDAAAQAAGVLGDVVSKAATAYATELAQTQTSTASAVMEQGLGKVETYLKTQPHLSPREVRDMLGDSIPPHVQAALDQSTGGDENERSIPTFLVGSAIHEAAAKQLAREVAPTIYAKQARSHFERAALAETVARTGRLEAALAEQGAHYMAAQQVATLDSRARNASTPEEWRSIYADLGRSSAIDPVQKVKVKAELQKMEDTQGKVRQAAGLAEGALAAGRDPVSPWVDASKAQAAFEKSVVGKDPLVVEEARHRFISSLEQADKARKMSDEPKLSRLETSLRQTGTMSRAGDDYTSLSPGGVATIEHLAQQERLRKDASSAEARRAAQDAERAQKQHDEIRFGGFDAMTAREKATADVSREAWKDVGDQAYYRIVKAKRVAAEEVAKDGGVGVDQRKKLITDEVAPLNYSTDSTNRLVSHIEARIAREFTKDKPPTNEDILRITADELIVGQVPGMVWGTNEETRWKAETQNQPFKPDPEEKQSIIVRDLAARGARPRATAADAAPEKAPVPGQPKKGDQVSGAMFGRSPKELWEYTGETNPNTGRPVVKRVK